MRFCCRAYVMADLGEDEDYDLKDEELVDFEGSDYGFESAEEEETVVAPGAPLPTAKVAPALGSGEIENVKDEGDGVIVQPPVIVVVDHPSKYRLARKPDLEDGELDDAAMPEGSDPEAIVNGGDGDEGGNDWRERKRRKDRYTTERQSIIKGRRDAEETAIVHNRQFRGRGSDRMSGIQRSNNFRGQKGVNTVPFQRGNSGPGIIGPGRPPVSMESEGHMALRFMGRGFPRPVGGVVAPGRLNQNEVNMQNHIGDSMAVQEHMLRHQQLVQMAQEQVQQAQAQAAHSQAQVQARARTHAHARVRHAQARAQAQVHFHMANSAALRASMSSSTMRPIMGLDLIRGHVHASRNMTYFQVQSPDSGSQINYPRPLEGFGSRALQSTDFLAVRGSVGQPLLNQPSNRDRTAAGRLLNPWSASSAVHHEIYNIPAARGRTQGQCRGQVGSPVWGEPPVGGIPTGYASSLGVLSVNGSPGIAPGVVGGLGVSKRLGSLPMMVPNNTAPNRENASLKKVDSRPQVDDAWKINGGLRGGHLNNGTLVPGSWNASSEWPNSSGGQARNKRRRENGMDREHGVKPASLLSVGNGMESTANNLIQLGGPVTKSRVLSVSGFPENTSMAVVVEAFEKQGLILDFRKDEKGNAFHITFSSVAEAVSAKRSLHRTLLNGRQITVDYTVQRY